MSENENNEANGKDEEETKLLQFPCDFPLKIIGSRSPDFANEIIAIVTKHYPELTEEHFKIKPSESGNFESITALVYAQSQDELDALYRELTQHPNIKMVL